MWLSAIRPVRKVSELARSLRCTARSALGIPVPNPLSIQDGGISLAMLDSSIQSDVKSLS